MHTLISDPRVSLAYSDMFCTYLPNQKKYFAQPMETEGLFSLVLLMSLLIHSMACKI